MTSSSSPMPPPDPSGDPSSGYGSAPAGYGPAPSGYGSAPAGYGPAPGGYGNGPGAAPRNGLGVAALIVGILALLAALTFVGSVVGWLLGIVAVVLGFLGRSRAKKGEADNGGIALGGIITGAIGFVLSVIFLVVVVSFGLFFSNSDAGTYLGCINDANGNQAAINQCSTEFDRNFGN